MMSVNTVLLIEENGVHIVSFHRDGQGLANVDLVRTFFASDFLRSTSGLKRLVVDLAGVASLDSASLGPLVQKLREIQELKGQLALSGVESPALREIFALTRFDKVFAIYRTRAEAVSAVKNP
jgi:anti-anti-sigma factor